MTSQRLTGRQAAVRIVQRLRRAGHTAYLAGGCVRDALLGIEPKDYDVATDARPEQVRRLWPSSRYVGEAFGVVLVNLGGQAIEVATFRSEWGYTDKRRPDQVVFSDAQHDAQRRDFTINGLFADPLQRDPATGKDQIIDYVGGLQDLRARRVRAIGDPHQRFAEDYLRMLRAVRIAARLDFQIEPGTAAAIRIHAAELGQISRERIGQEVQWMLTGPRPAQAADMMQSLGLDGPALQEPARQAPLPTLTALSQEAAYPTRLAAWMLDRHVQPPPIELERLARFVEREASRMVSRWRGALCLSNQQRDELMQVLQLAARAAAWEAMGVAQRKRLLAEPLWGQALELLRALPERQAVERIERQAQPLLEEGVAPPPLVNGDDLIRMGLQPGPDFRRLLDGVYDAQLEGRVRDRQEALAWVARLAS